MNRREFINVILASASFLTPFSRVCASGKPLIFGIFPRRNIKTTYKLFTPMAEYLSQQLGLEVRLETTKSFNSFWKNIKKRRYDLVHFNQYHYIVSHEYYGQDVILANKKLGVECVHERTQELQILNSKIAHEAMYEQLTGLPNRILVIDQLQLTISHAMKERSSLAVFMFDLNNFKEVNDTLGHPEGDRLLIDVAQRLSQAVRESDIVGRLGGDEFAMVLPDINEE